MTMFDNISTEELINFINSDALKWKGFSGGDTVEKYQGRQAAKAAACLILMARDLSSDECKIPREDAVLLFFDHIRHIGNEYEGQGNSNFDLAAAKNYWKLMYE